jgi:hypothetical protein
MEGTGKQNKATAQRRPWTKEEDSLLAAKAAEGRSAKEIATLLRRDRSSVYFRTYLLQIHLQDHRLRKVQRQKEIYQRRCLRCRKPFQTPFRTIFLCEPCKESEVWRCWDLSF